MIRRFVIRRSREELHAYAAALQARQGIPIEAVVSTYLHGELLYALLHSGAAPWVGITAGAALHRAYASSRWHPDLELVTDHVPGWREMERWHESIDFAIAKAYGLKWTRIGISKSESSTVFMAGELSWLEEPPLCDPIKVRMVRTQKMKTEPVKIKLIHEVTPLPLADMILHVEPVNQILARTVIGLTDDPLVVSRCVYDLSMLHLLNAKAEIGLMREGVEARKESPQAVKKRLDHCAMLFAEQSDDQCWTDYLACELASRPMGMAKSASRELLASGTELIRAVASNL